MRNALTYLEENALSGHDSGNRTEKFAPDPGVLSIISRPR
jgi:hypothetical protein